MLTKIKDFKQQHKQLELIRDQQKASWDKFSPGWKKWDNLFMDFLKPMGDEIICLLKLNDTDVVLDIASGTGEPALTIAQQLKKGKVILTDVSEKMLDIARENATAKSINNIYAFACDACKLPFHNSTFNAISCRFGFMFFPDMKLAAKEMFRVLKPGGRIATSVWNVPEKNFWVTGIMKPISKHMLLPAPNPDAPGMFRCAYDGLIADLFEQIGFTNISVTEVQSKLACKTTDVYWAMMNELAAPVVAALNNADEATKAAIKKEVYQNMQEKFPDGNVLIDSSALVIYGEK